MAHRTKRFSDPRNSRRRRSVHVVLLIETSNAYGRGILQGVNTYIQEHGHWTIYLAERGRGERAPAWLAGWRGDGILARIENQAIAKVVLESGLPTVDLCTTAMDLGLPSVQADEDATVRLALDHLRERGFERFGFYSVGGVGGWSENRREHFRRLLAETDFEHHIFEGQGKRRRAAAYLEEQDDLMRWVAQLPKPIGLMAGHDLSGHQVLNACGRAGISVPDQVVGPIDGTPKRAAEAGVDSTLGHRGATLNRHASDA
jgi:LacI family transcriptional regulator